MILEEAGLPALLGRVFTVYAGFWVVVLVGLFVLTVALPVVGVVHSTFFPQSDSDLVFVNIETPSGTELSVSTHVPSATMSPVVWHNTLAATQHTVKVDFFKFRAWGLNR